MVCEPGKVGRFLVVAADGDFSFEQQPVSLSDLMLRADQMEPAILYLRTFRMNRADGENKQLFELLLLGLWGRGKGYIEPLPNIIFGNGFMRMINESSRSRQGKSVDD